jgi:hypothetical protein
MTNKQTILAPKVWFHIGATGNAATSLVARLKNALRIDIPVGYQDETGFHAGIKPSERSLNWPSNW